MNERELGSTVAPEPRDGRKSIRVISLTPAGARDRMTGVLGKNQLAYWEEVPKEKKRRAVAASRVQTTSSVY